MVLAEREYCGAVGGETGDHVRLADDDLSVQDVVVGVVAMVDDKGELDHEACGVALAVGAGVRLIGRQAVVGQKLRVAVTVDDDASAGAFHLGGDVKPSAHEVKILILKCIGIDGDGGEEDGPVGVLGKLAATSHEERRRH